ncbi:UvrD-helicase domain-containing protein [Shewanella sp. 10N.286.45.A1]|uniref:UvrD-helicase domain-containing protein n=1 Tax=Shewanella sp. 10N.286.45.A1 TaxID=3229694 RepID=UPI00354D037A
MKKLAIAAEKEQERVEKEAERAKIEAKAEVERVKNKAKEKAERARERQEKNRLHAERKALIQQKTDQLLTLFSANYLNAESHFNTHCKGVISQAEFDKLRINFVRNWLVTYSPKRDAKQLNLDDEQALAIASVNGNVQVIARAGSGKTTTLVLRAFFLIKHCNINPQELLLLAFNRKAAQEVRKKLMFLLSGVPESQLAQKIDELKKRNSRDVIATLEAKAIEQLITQYDINLPNVFTFHALAYAIVHPEESPLFDSEDNQSLSRLTQGIIDDYLRDSKHQAEIKHLMMAHFKEDWIRIVSGGYEQDKATFLQYRRSLPQQSLKGEYVKSYGEKLIADFLFEHDIDYKYERNHTWDNINYRPDFTLFKTAKSGVIIEYFGLKGDPDYDEMSYKKQQYWKDKNNWDLLFYTPVNIAEQSNDNFLNHLQKDIEAQGFICNKLSDEEIWQRCKERAIDRFTAAMVAFIGRCRKESLSEDEMALRYNNYKTSSEVEAQFLKFSTQFYTDYLNTLKNTGEDDFDGLIQKASSILTQGKTTFETKSTTGELSNLKYLFIDEYQDFSHLFNELIQSIKKAAPKVDLFCVGDDWQAINGFAGSNLKYFKEINRYISEPKQLEITTNYRSPTPIVELGNKLMQGLGTPAKANKSHSCTLNLVDMANYKPVRLELERHSGDIITPAVLRIINQSLLKEQDVVLLCRKNSISGYIFWGASEIQLGSLRGLDKYLQFIRSFFPEEQRNKITISTSHRYKGLEKPTVIVMDLVKRSYPLIHPDWVFHRFFGTTLETIIEEERRLLYVALTRAEKDLFIITDTKEPSPFFDNIRSATFMNAIQWDTYPPFVAEGQVRRVSVHIKNFQYAENSGTFPIKDLLNASGYRWRAVSKTWEKTFPMEEFDINILTSEVWYSAATNLQVDMIDDTQKHINTWYIGC